MPDFDRVSAAVAFIIGLSIFSIIDSARWYFTSGYKINDDEGGKK